MLAGGAGPVARNGRDEQDYFNAQSLVEAHPYKQRAVDDY